MKIKIQIKSRITGVVLFEYEKENNTISDTLIKAIERNENLTNADLRGAYLLGADLRGVTLCGVDLRGATLYGADLFNASLLDADFRGADLRGADLRGTNLRGAKFSGADLRGAKGLPPIPLACPSDGAFIGWKKVKGCLIQLLIPEDAKRSSATTRKCRCEFAKVLSITHIKKGEKLESIENDTYEPSVVYRVGEIVRPDSFDEDRWNECSHGIHFFISKQDAIDY